MRMIRTAGGLVLSFVILSVGISGCSGSSFSFSFHDDSPAYTHVHVDHVDHVCTRGCNDHYYDGSRIVVIGGGHRHHAGCGHRWDGGHWIVFRTSSHVVTEHVCSYDCNHHYWDGGKLIVIARGHRHHSGCGHHWDGHRWIAVRKISSHALVAHVCTRGCHNHYWNGSRLVTLNIGHHHGPGCGHSWSGTHWILAHKSNAHRVGKHRAPSSARPTHKSNAYRKSQSNQQPRKKLKGKTSKKRD